MADSPCLAQGKSDARDSSKSLGSKDALADDKQRGTTISPDELFGKIKQTMEKAFGNSITESDAKNQTNPTMIGLFNSWDRLGMKFVRWLQKGLKYGTKPCCGYGGGNYNFLNYLWTERRYIQGKEIQCHLPLFWFSSSWISAIKI
ncbi:hypothetical protein E2542_SST28984 [Spatholobus suberectus]|nr:hypothetical protein E2542_SST28984 [Spatholobus suberectus]